MPTTESAAYTRTAIALHWAIALAIFCALALGWSFDYFSGSTKSAMIGLHKSLGITILLLSLARLGWRLTHRAPPLPVTMPVWQQHAAYTVHFLLYLAMIGIPLSGWAMTSASGHNIVLYGLVPWPQMPVLPTLANKQEVAQTMFSIHSTGALMFAVLIAGHAAAGMFHHFIERDDVLLRILPHSCAGFLNRLR
jgi:cytochrome b561